jgi:hypothetical protein
VIRPSGIVARSGARKRNESCCAETQLQRKRKHDEMSFDLAGIAKILEKHLRSLIV